MSTEITPEVRRRLSKSIGISDAYLYQCLAGIRDMNPARARELEIQTKGKLRRWALCQKSWFAIWPELVKAKGAPPVPATKAAEGA